MESERGLFLFPHPLPLVVSANVALLMHLQLACGMPQKKELGNILSLQNEANQSTAKQTPNPKPKAERKGKIEEEGT